MDEENRTLDFLVIRAGISGIGVSVHLKKSFPHASLIVLESLESFGGTWLVHKYPGTRADSDFFTFAYEFKPWTGSFLADSASILCYLQDVIRENDLEKIMRFGHHVSSICWNSKANLWEIDGKKQGYGPFSFRCKFAILATGYYPHGPGYTPDFPGIKSFRGKVVHPQAWPDNFDYAGKKVVIIGSGATCATLAPEMSKTSSVTVIQRSPSYYRPVPKKILELISKLREQGADATSIHHQVREAMVLLERETLQRAIYDPDGMKRDLIEEVHHRIGDSFDSKHFTPKYRPWSQRLLVGAEEFFDAVSSKRIGIKTDEIRMIENNAVVLASGEKVLANIIVTATGFGYYCLIGGILLHIDGEPKSLAECFRYRGLMYGGIPNFFWIQSYKFFSWTLRVELDAKWICKLWKYMTENNFSTVAPIKEPKEKATEKPKLLFSPKWVMRSLRLFPKEGARSPWKMNDDYVEDKAEMESTAFPETDPDLKFQ